MGGGHARFISRPTPPSNPDLRRVGTTEEALALLREALPDFACPICRSADFELLDAPELNQATAVMHYSGLGAAEIASSTDVDPVAVAGSPTLTVICRSCGFVLPFEEDTLRARAKAETGNAG